MILLTPFLCGVLALLVAAYLRVRLPVWSLTTAVVIVAAG